MASTAIIPARGGSVRIPRKNIREFFGKPVIAYSIEAAIDSGLFTGVYVSTEDKEIADIAESYGAKVIWREEHLAVDNVGTQEVIRSAITAIGVACEDYVCCIYPVAPMIDVVSLRIAYRTLLTDEHTEYVVPCGKWLRDPGQWYYGLKRAFINGTPLLGLRTRMVPIRPETDCDVNTEMDWQCLVELYETYWRDKNEQ